MRLFRLGAPRLPVIGVLAIVFVLSLIASAQSQSAQGKKTKSGSCSHDDSGLKLPAGFCATVFAEGIGHARHLVVSSGGVVYVNTWSGDYYDFDKTHEGGFLVALQDKTGNGKADVIERFGETVQTGGAGGVGIGLYKGSIYAEINDRIVRYALPADAIVPKDAPETVVSKLPLGGDHPMHPFIIGADGFMYVDVASATNSCQPKNRQPKIPGDNPCTELETRGGVWRYDANKTNQIFSPAERYGTGIRNGEGFAFDSMGRLFVTQHGRDQLHSNWPELYKPEEEATLPAEELVLLKFGGDYGWPECYYDGVQKKLVLAPEYGGNGGKAVGVCASKMAPVAAFPAHWGPNAAVHYDGKNFPNRYRDGVFIAFHGSWNRAPYAQGGYNVVFQPLDGDHASGTCEIFGDGFAGAKKTPEGATYRPTGLAVGPDGALYISEDIHGRIYRVTYTGDPAGPAPKGTPCPSLSAPAGKVVASSAQPPESNTENLPVPGGSTADMVALGARIFHGQVAGASCTGCHGANGTGSPLGPDLTKKQWLWSDGSFAGILKVITEGVPQPKQYRSPMPPMGGAQLSGTQASALAAYVWGLSHPVSTSSTAANDPFVGKWKVNPSTSKLNDEMKVEVAGANRYAITFAPGLVDTVVADGSDQPALRGTTLSVTVKGPNNWVVIRKMKGRTLLTGYWTLSQDGKTLNDAYTEYAPDGSTSSVPYVYERTAGNSGFPGTWDSESEKVKAGIELEIRPYEGDGLSLNSPDAEMTKKMKFDGNDYPDLDPNEDPGSACSGRRVNERSLEITEKFKDKITGTRQIELSADLKTLTMTTRLVGQSRPKSILVFDRE